MSCPLVIGYWLSFILLEKIILFNEKLFCVMRTCQYFTRFSLIAWKKNFKLNNKI